MAYAIWPAQDQMVQQVCTTLEPDSRAPEHLSWEPWLNPMARQTGHCERLSETLSGLLEDLNRHGCQAQ